MLLLVKLIFELGFPSLLPKVAFSEQKQLVHFVQRREHIHSDDRHSLERAPNQNKIHEQFTFVLFFRARACEESMHGPLPVGFAGSGEAQARANP